MLSGSQRDFSVSACEQAHSAEKLKVSLLQKKLAFNFLRVPCFNMHTAHRYLLDACSLSASSELRSCFAVY